jgi:hypothetical protein
LCEKKGSEGNAQKVKSGKEQEGAPERDRSHHNARPGDEPLLDLLALVGGHTGVVTFGVDLLRDEFSGELCRLILSGDVDDGCAVAAVSEEGNEEGEFRFGVESGLDEEFEAVLSGKLAEETQVGGRKTHFGRNAPVEKTPSSRSISKPLSALQMSTTTEGVAVAVRQRTRSALTSLPKRDTFRYSARNDGPHSDTQCDSSTARREICCSAIIETKISLLSLRVTVGVGAEGGYGCGRWDQVRKMGMGAEGGKAGRGF